MRRVIWLAPILLVQQLAAADTLLLRDGRMIEWRAVVDRGDSYEVETVKGDKVPVKKADVEKLSWMPPAAAPPPLTGGSFTLDRKAVVFDVLKTVDPKRDALSGNWRMTAKGLEIDATTPHAKLETMFPLPEEYDLQMVVERKGDEGEFFVGLVGGSRRFSVHFDSPGRWSGHTLVDGKNIDAHGMGVRGDVFKKGVPRTILFMVRKDAFAVKIDGKDFIIWPPDWKKVSLLPFLTVNSKDCLFLGAWGGKFRILGVAATVFK